MLFGAADMTLGLRHGRNHHGACLSDPRLRAPAFCVRRPTLEVCRWTSISADFVLSLPELRLDTEGFHFLESSETSCRNQETQSSSFQVGRAGPQKKGEFTLLCRYSASPAGRRLLRVSLPGAPFLRMLPLPIMLIVEAPVCRRHCCFHQRNVGRLPCQDIGQHLVRRSPCQARSVHVKKVPRRPPIDRHASFRRETPRLRH